MAPGCDADPTQRFSSRAGDYARYRPGYPPRTLNILRDTTGLTSDATIADVANRIEGKGAVLFAHEAGWYHPDEKDGVFSSRLPPGRYQARAMSGDDVVGISEWFDLVAGEEREGEESRETVRCLHCANRLR